MSSRLERLSRRVDGDPFFLASVLAAYTQAESLDEAGLASALGCPVETLASLRLCRRPRADSQFRGDVEAIADRFGVDALSLAEIIRRVDALAALRTNKTSRSATKSGHGVLIAARDGGDSESPSRTDEAGDPDRKR